MLNADSLKNKIKGIEETKKQSFLDAVSRAYELKQNYPNPFNPNTIIKFQIANLSNTKLVVYDALGKEVATLVNELLKPSSYEVNWDASNYPSGVYFYKLQTETFSQTRKLVLLK